MCAVSRLSIPHTHHVHRGLKRPNGLQWKLNHGLISLIQNFQQWYDLHHALRMAYIQNCVKTKILVWDKCTLTQETIILQCAKRMSVVVLWFVILCSTVSFCRNLLSSSSGLLQFPSIYWYQFLGIPCVILRSAHSEVLREKKLVSRVI